MASKRRNPLEASNASPSSSEEEADSEQSEVEEKQPPPQQPNGAVEEEGEDESVETGEEEEEDGDDDEDDDDDDEEEEEKSSETKSTVVPSATNPPPRPNSPSGSGSDSGSGSESETDDDDSDKTPPSPNLSDFTIKPITTFKRALETESSGSKKLMSTSSGGGGGDEEDDDDGVEESEKKGSAVKPRLWSPEDEIALLEGMIEYQSKNGTILSTDMDAFHDFIKKSLQTEVSKSQLIHKIRRLKNKFRTNMGKGESGEESSFSKPHEGKSFRLSKNVWGCSNENHGKKSNHVNGSSSSVKNKRKANDAANVESVLALPIQDGTGIQPVVSNWGVKKVRKEDVVGSFESTYPFLNMIVESGNFVDPLLPTVESLVKEDISLVESSKVKEWDRKWKKLLMDQAELHLEEMDLIKEITELVLNARRTSYSESLGDLGSVITDG